MHSNGKIRIAFKVHRTTELADRKLTLSGLNRTHLGCAKMVRVFLHLEIHTASRQPEVERICPMSLSKLRAVVHPSLG